MKIFLIIGLLGVILTGGLVVTGVRGIRNKNPGNIRLSTDQWRGLSSIQNDGEFFQFTKMKYGVRAMAKLLRNYQHRYGLDSVRDIINRWAPPNENNTSAYVNAVSRDLGVKPDDRINMFDDDTLFAMTRAIIKHENGTVPALTISDSTVQQGIALI